MPHLVVQCIYSMNDHFALYCRLPSENKALFIKFAFKDNLTST